MTPEEIKKVKIDLLWELIQDWQDAREKAENIHTPKFSFNDIEVELYNKMQQIEPFRTEISCESKLDNPQ